MRRTFSPHRRVRQLHRAAIAAQNLIPRRRRYGWFMDWRVLSRTGSANTGNPPYSISSYSSRRGVLNRLRGGRERGWFRQGHGRIGWECAGTLRGMIVCWAVSVMSSSLRTIAWVRRCVVTAWGPLRRRNLCVSLRHMFATDVCRVKELADVAGTTVRTVRHYHHVGSLPGLAAARGRATTGLTTSRGLSASAGWARPRGAARQRAASSAPTAPGRPQRASRINTSIAVRTSDGRWLAGSQNSTRVVALALIPGSLWPHKHSG